MRGVGGKDGDDVNYIVSEIASKQQWGLNWPDSDKVARAIGILKELKCGKATQALLADEMFSVHEGGRLLCRTVDAGCTVAKARARGRQRGWSGVAERSGSTARTASKR